MPDLIHFATLAGGGSHAVPLGKVPVEVHPDAGRPRQVPGVLPPQPVVGPAVLVPVRVHQGQDVPLEVARLVVLLLLQHLSRTITWN